MTRDEVRLHVDRLLDEIALLQYGVRYSEATSQQQGDCIVRACLPFSPAEIEAGDELRVRTRDQGE